MLVYLPIFVLSFLILLYLTYKDIRFREINITYLFIIPIFSMIYLLFVHNLNKVFWSFYFKQIIISLIFLLFIYLLGKITEYAYIGEGDLYCFFFLSFINVFDFKFIIYLFLGSLVFSLFIPLFLFVYNLFSLNFSKYSFFKSISLMFLGYPLKLNKINDFYSPLERVNNSKLSLNIKPLIEPKKEINKLKRSYSLNKKIWVSPLLPFILFIILSFILIISLYLLNIF